MQDGANVPQLSRENLENLENSNSGDHDVVMDSERNGPETEIEENETSNSQNFEEQKSELENLLSNLKIY